MTDSTLKVGDPITVMFVNGVGGKAFVVEPLRGDYFAFTADRAFPSIHLPSGTHSYASEGIFWCRGWTGTDVDALQAAYLLRRQEGQLVAHQEAPGARPAVNRACAAAFDKARKDDHK